MYVPYPALPMCTPSQQQRPSLLTSSGGGMVTSSCHWLCVPRPRTLDIDEEASQLHRVADPHNKKRAQIAIAPRGSGVPGMSAPGAEEAAPLPDLR